MIIRLIVRGTEKEVTFIHDTAEWEMFSDEMLGDLFREAMKEIEKAQGGE